VVAGDDVKEPKPNPEPYLMAAERLGVDIHHSVAFEDSVFGAASALSEVEFEFMNYIAQFGKTYANIAEYEMRLAEFTKKHEFIQEHNAGDHQYTAGHNKMSDWTDEEYKAILTYKSEGTHVASEEPEEAFVGAAINWISNGCVNGIKDQGQCGSCWAFSGVASTEGAWCIAHNKLYSLSEQQLVDCDTRCYGCNGGWAYRAIQYFETHYAESESSYPYTARDGSCKYNSSNATVVKTASYVNVTADSISAMKTALNSHILSVAIEADKYCFQTYSSGIFNNSNCGTSLDHATNVVGWGTSGGVDYWIMRNSWGKSWGMSGYMHVQQVAGKGICGIQMEPVYATV